MILVIETQHYENYAWHEDGTLGIGKDAYWKAKGGDSIKVTNVTADMDLDAIVDTVRGDIEVFNDGFRVNIIGYGLEADDWMSDFERSQLEYEGKITYREREINWDQVVEEILA